MTAASGSRAAASSRIASSPPPCRSSTGRGRRILAELRAALAKIVGVRRTGSAAIDLAWVASGRFDGLWQHNLSPWDMRPRALFVREAGGCSPTPRAGTLPRDRHGGRRQRDDPPPAARAAQGRARRETVRATRVADEILPTPQGAARGSRRGTCRHLDRGDFPGPVLPDEDRHARASRVGVASLSQKEGSASISRQSLCTTGQEPPVAGVGDMGEREVGRGHSVSRKRCGPDIQRVVEHDHREVAGERRVERHRRGSSVRRGWPSGRRTHRAVECPLFSEPRTAARKWMSFKRKRPAGRGADDAVGRRDDQIGRDQRPRALAGCPKAADIDLADRVPGRTCLCQDGSVVGADDARKRLVSPGCSHPPGDKRHPGGQGGPSRAGSRAGRNLIVAWPIPARRHALGSPVPDGISRNRRYFAVSICWQITLRIWGDRERA